MDKKFYLNPEIEVVDLELEGSLLDGSDGVPDEGGAATELPGGTTPFIDPNED